MTYFVFPVMLLLHGNMGKQLIVVSFMSLGFAALSLPYRNNTIGLFQPRGTLAADCTPSVSVKKRPKSHPMMSSMSLVGYWAMCIRLICSFNRCS